MKWGMWVALAILFIAGFALGAIVVSPHINDNTHTLTNSGGILPVVPIASVTNSITNRITLTNILNLYADDRHYHTDPFIGVQKKDNFSCSVYRRSGDFKLTPWITEKNIIVGGGVEYVNNKLSPNVLAGYEIDWCGGFLSGWTDHLSANGFIRF
jgi:hypothetical protein